jgi:hypothetical protein
MRALKSDRPRLMSWAGLMSATIVGVGVMADGHAAGPTTLDICVHKNSGSVRVVVPPHTCHRSEYLVSIPLTAQSATSIFGGAVTLVDANGNQSPTGTRVLFSGVDEQIVNGSGSTSGPTPAGKGGGNLIIGYDETTTGAVATCSNGAYANQTDCVSGGGTWGANQHTGYHDLVIGSGHSYTSYGGLVTGLQNIINRSYASVSGGTGNSASGVSSSVGGGTGNSASGDYSSVSAGKLNVASSEFSSVSGGRDNTSSGSATSVTGGGRNTASSPTNSAGAYVGFGATVSGGYGNTSSGDLTTVSGGVNNSAQVNQSSISGGQNNVTLGFDASISGGNGITVNVNDGWAAGTLHSP